MKVYISVDIEGVACVTHPDHTKLEGTEYEMARKWMTAEANAAIEGALEAGATGIVVADSHGHMRNMLPDELHEDALLVRGSPRPLTMMEGLDETFDAAFFVGYHSMAGTAKGVLSHTYIGRMVYAIRLNGIAVGEPGFNAAIAGHFGVPLALVCGDDTVDAEVGALLPWTERVITKWALSSLAARSLTPKASQKRIRQGAKRALGRLSEMKPWTLETPIRFEVDFMGPIYAYLAADVPGVECVNERTLAYTGADMLQITRIWRLMINASLGEHFV
ncbi:MAG: M55 family metallopeptidase [Anaerolineae bacterium]